jgi:hypothetical protein
MEVILGKFCQDSIDSPTEVLTGQNPNGIIMAVLVANANATGTQTLIKLQVT